MRGLPELPPSDVRLPLWIVGPELVAGLLGGQVLHDCAALPELEIAIDEGRNLPVRVQSQILGLLQIAAAHAQLDDLYGEAEVSDRGVDASAVVRVVDAIELHGCLLFAGQRY